MFVWCGVPELLQSWHVVETTAVISSTLSLNAATIHDINKRYVCLFINWFPGTWKYANLFYDWAPLSNGRYDNDFAAIWERHISCMHQCTVIPANFLNQQPGVVVVVVVSSFDSSFFSPLNEIFVRLFACVVLAISLFIYLCRHQYVIPTTWWHFWAAGVNEEKITAFPPIAIRSTTRARLPACLPARPSNRVFLIVLSMELLPYMAYQLRGKPSYLLLPLCYIPRYWHLINFSWRRNILWQDVLSQGK